MLRDKYARESRLILDILITLLIDLPKLDFSDIIKRIEIPLNLCALGVQTQYILF